MSSSQDLALESHLHSTTSTIPHILIVDDEPIFRRALRLNLERENFLVSEASTLQEGRLALGLNSNPKENKALDQRVSKGDHAIDLVLCDWKLEVNHQGRLHEESGLTLVEELKTSHQSPLEQSPEVLFMSAHASQQIALRAIELGAADFIMKPFETSELLFRVKRLLRERERLRRLNEAEARLADGEDQLGGLVGRSPKMRDLFRLIRRVAPTQSKLLIQGESGTGKELVARAIHQLAHSHRGKNSKHSAPFIALNCASIPESLIESELFGHAQGAFTHAQHDRRGLIEEANGGTLFLDEIGELPLHLQAKLLRVIQEGEVRRLGANQTQTLEVRFVAATLKDLSQEVKEGRFRADLYYRLNVITLELPPLRERLEDLPLLISQLIKRLCSRLERTPPRLSSNFLETLKCHTWPGNVRELENALEHAMILSDPTEEIGIDKLPYVLQTLNLDHTSMKKDLWQVDENTENISHMLEILSPQLSQESLSIKLMTKAVEETLIKEALRRSGGIKTQAAKMLEISTKTLLYKLREYQIDFEE